MPALVGRDRELELLRSLLAKAGSVGGAVILSGEPGSGKTALLNAAESLALQSGVRVLRAGGVEFEASVTFAGLNQALLALRPGLAALISAHRVALEVALGFDEGPPPQPLVLANATLDLLCAAAGLQPLLLVIDDLHWLDRSSAIILGLVARRLAGSRIGLIAATRTEAETFFDRSGIPTHELTPLGLEAATALLSSRYPALAPRVRQRILAEAGGNPLALLELPAILTAPQRLAAERLPAVLPLSGGLQAMFADRVRALPSATHGLLLLAVLEGTGDLGVLGATAGQEAIASLAPAEQTHLIKVRDGDSKLSFRHPLVRSVIVQMSTSAERREAHRALAEALQADPDRRVWHLAEASVGSDAHAADLLVDHAHRILRRGDPAGAVAALLRSADLTPSGPDRARRLSEAAYVGANVTGDLRNVAQLLRDAEHADPAVQLGGSLLAAVAASYALLNGEGDIATAHRLLVGAIEMETDLPMVRDAFAEALHTLMLVCFFGGRPELWPPFYTALARLGTGVPEPLGVCSQVFPDTIRAAPAALERLADAVRDLRDVTEPTRIIRIAMASTHIDLAGCRSPLLRVVRDGRQGGAVTSAIFALMFLGLDDYHSGRWDEALSFADEGLALCDEHGYHLLGLPGHWIRALVAAARGDHATTARLTDQMLQWAQPRGIYAIQSEYHFTRALAALAENDFEGAFQHASAISPPGRFNPHKNLGLWAMMDLVEAAVRTGRNDEATAHVEAIRAGNVAAISPRIALLAGASAALAAPDDLALGLFKQALAAPGADRWPFDYGRVQLAFGERLRRARRTAESRAHLSIALDAFERLGARPWATRAAGELRATGQTRARTDQPARDPLTPQEREIAMLAAAGLSNKEIGQQLFLSHRTVGAHLYQIFPKLGITSRAALRDALASFPPEPQGDDRSHP